MLGPPPGAELQPLVSRLAGERRLHGMCQTTPRGVVVEVEGEPAQLDEFRAALERQRPAQAVVEAIERERFDRVVAPFRARNEPGAWHASTEAKPDLVLCESCRGELFDPNNRRYRYPFINCAHCGPRSSIVDRLPYTRANTSMRGFSMCHACQREYHDPLDRRYHAEPNACPVCGPHVALWDAAGVVVAERNSALTAAANAIRAGRIMAVKSPGGFRLAVDATDEAAVLRLRARQHGDDTPFIVMCPDFEFVQMCARFGADEARLLASIYAPIVLVDPRLDHPEALAPSVLGGSRQLGVMLPSTPLQVLLMRDLRRPIALTSSPRPGELPCVDDREVVARFGGIADGFLVHNRPVLHPLHDSVVRVFGGAGSSASAAVDVSPVA